MDTNRTSAVRLVIISGFLVQLIGILAIPLIAVYVFPVLRPFNQGLSVGYVVFRSMEAILLVGVAIYTLSMIPISQEFLSRERADAMLFQQIGVSIQAVSHWTFIFNE